MDSISKSNNKTKGQNYESEERRSTETTQQTQKDFENVFDGIEVL